MLESVELGAVVAGYVEDVSGGGEVRKSEAGEFMEKVQCSLTGSGLVTVIAV